MLTYHAVELARRLACRPSDDVEPFAVMPQIGIGGKRVVFFDSAQRHESKPDPLDQRAEVGAGRHGYLVAACTQSKCKADVGMYIAGATDGNQQGAHGLRAWEFIGDFPSWDTIATI